jgi:hydroxymethylglutaryl-CoA synthase
MFSYGSGLASSMFSMQLTTDVKLLEHLVSNLNDIRTRLDQRICVSPAEFVNILTKNEETHHKAPYQPAGAIETLHPSAYYLVEVDSMYRRRYARRSLDGTPVPNGNCNSAVSDCPAV